MKAHFRHQTAVPTGSGSWTSHPVKLSRCFRRAPTRNRSRSAPMALGCMSRMKMPALRACSTSRRARSWPPLKWGASLRESEPVRTDGSSTSRQKLTTRSRSSTQRRMRSSSDSRSVHGPGPRRSRQTVLARISHLRTAEPSRSSLHALRHWPGGRDGLPGHGVSGGRDT